ncbi:FAD-dependent oxidoreductase [Microtetraspora sp. NBRC 16547]|uniref:NAD(P)/FAD-dependent oxidoreductase n=1 Tax=Microtetraspora sp. NBRC 16547 TaxID=3030993 RepID=UPI0024A29C79|nr:FAD-dependent oxidoreductase [Microtetraspora sp. NBRC 16547]GLW96524.1 glycine oxidase [Microtetraspora sp. NBRC 16547]
MRETCDVAIVGGGVIGCAIAHRLRSEGRSVVVVEAASQLGLGASDAAMGGILTQTESSCLGRLSPVIKYSRDLYPDWLAELAELTGVEVPVLDGGDIQVALDDDEMTRLRTEVLPKWEASPFAVEQLTAAEARSLEPLLSEAVVGGFLLPEELALDPRELMAVLRATMERAGVGVRVGTRALRVESGPEGAIVELRDGGVIHAGTVVVAAGHLSGLLLPALDAVMLPIKGEAFNVRRPGFTTYPLRHHVFAEITSDGHTGYPYLVPRHDGRLAVGVTYEVGVGDPTPTAEGRAEISRWAAALMPAVADWPVERHWAGLRPASADHIPIIGYVDDHRSLLAATGHAGLGITLAPATAELVSAVLNGHADEHTRERLELCRPDRSFTSVTTDPTPAPTAP